MAEIALLNQDTIDKIAAGEVIERPSSVVKELVENSIDAGATAVTVEIKDGGISLIRVTDNGCGIEKSQTAMAFLRHSTSKIRSVEDLLNVSSLGFRGEALSSIAAVAQVELVTKTVPELTGIRYVIEGSVEKEREEIGAPDGTTFLVRNLFYNTPARQKFLKSPQTEAGYVCSLVERLALSRPDISFKLIVNNQPRLHTSGNSSPKDVIYQIYGREIAGALIDISQKNDLFSVEGFIGKPVVSRGNRNFENYFINRRYIRSPLIAKSIEDAYKNFLMQRQYPFCALYFDFDGAMLDVNVHPAKLELRFYKNEGIYQMLYDCIRDRLKSQEHIRAVSPGGREKKENRNPRPKEKPPEPFEKNRMERLAREIRRDSPYESKYPGRDAAAGGARSADADCKGKASAGSMRNASPENGRNAPWEAAPGNTAPGNTAPGNTAPGKYGRQDASGSDSRREAMQGQEASGHGINPGIDPGTGPSTDLGACSGIDPGTGSSIDPGACQDINPGTDYGFGKAAPAGGYVQNESPAASYVQEEITFEGRFLSEQAKGQHRIIGQAFDTYWLVEYGEKLFIIDQHAAHEKVLYERMLASLKNKEFTTQQMSPPLVLSLDRQEEQALADFGGQLARLGFEIEPFGGREYAVCGVPDNLYSLDPKQILLEVLDAAEELHRTSAPEIVLEKIASMSCKAAVKGNHALDQEEAKALIEELLELENPYFCPHGRPTIISMSKYELEKKFKRIV